MRAGVSGGVYHYPCGVKGTACRLLDKAARQCGFLLPPGLKNQYSIGIYMYILVPEQNISDAFSRWEDSVFFFFLITFRVC